MVTLWIVSGISAPTAHSSPNSVPLAHGGEKLIQREATLLMTELKKETHRKLTVNVKGYL
jgi:hypothetical protein